jgi:hypothetical protein
MASQNDRPNFITRVTVVYAPMPAKPAYISGMRPVKPESRFIPEDHRM